MINELCLWQEENDILTIKQLLSIYKVTRLTLRNRLQELQENELVEVTTGFPKKIFLTDKGKEARQIALQWRNLVKL